MTTVKTIMLTQNATKQNGILHSYGITNVTLVSKLKKLKKSLSYVTIYPDHLGTALACWGS